MILTEDQTAIRDAVRDFAQERTRLASSGYEAAGGYLEEFGLAKIYRDVRVCQIY